MKNMVTIKDIARESGYSVSTVSRVLNHRNDVSPDAKKKIEKVVAAYNFVPNNNAKHLKQSNSKSIGVLVKGIQNMLFASIVEEIQCMIENTDYTLIVSYLDCAGRCAVCACDKPCRPDGFSKPFFCCDRRYRRCKMCSGCVI